MAWSSFTKLFANGPSSSVKRGEFLSILATIFPQVSCCAFLVTSYFAAARTRKGSCGPNRKDDETQDSHDNCRTYNGHTMKPRTLLIIAFVLLVSPSLTSASQDDDAAVIDSFIERQAKRERGEEYKEGRRVMTGDLTHDGEPETVVLYTIEGQGGSNLYIQYLAVFTRKNDKLTPLTHADVGGKSTRGVELTSVENNSIFLNTLSYGPKDASCCPSIKGTTRYTLSGSKLFEQKRGKSSPRHLPKQ